MNFVDSVVLIGYFLFMVAVGIIFHNLSKKSTSEYFRGGGKMLWWMVGATAFMTQFSAWTFTGAAQKAYTDGFTVVMIFLGNILGFYINGKVTAARFRRLDVVTPIEAVKARFGAGNAQLYIWTSLPFRIIYAGIWLSGLAVFVSAVTHYNITNTIIGVGIVVAIISVVGGSWGIIASDFLQMLVIIAVAIVTTIFALVEGGGITQIVHDYPRNFMHGDSLTYISVFVLWSTSRLLQQVMNTNHMMDAYRFLSAKDAHNASKAGMLAAGLMCIGVFIWFVPPWVSASMFPDLGALYPELGKKAGSAAYLAFVQHAMPAGMVGILMAAIFAATMSSMDVGLNTNSGIFTRNFYGNVLRKNKASDKELMFVAKVSSLVFGAIIILVALFITKLKGLSLYNAMLYFSSLIGLPTAIPILFGAFVNRIPKWGPAATIAFGGMISWYAATLDYSALTGIEFSKRELADLRQLTGTFAHFFLTGGFFLMTRFFYKPEADLQYDAMEKTFFDTMEGRNTSAKMEQDTPRHHDNLQRSMLGRLIMAMGGLIMLITFVPQEASEHYSAIFGHMAFVLCGGLIFIAGFFLYRASKTTIVSATDDPDGVHHDDPNH